MTSSLRVAILFSSFVVASGLRCKQSLSYSGLGKSSGGHTVPVECPAAATYCVEGNATLTQVNEETSPPTNEETVFSFQCCSTYLKNITTVYFDSAPGVDGACDSIDGKPGLHPFAHIVKEDWNLPKKEKLIANIDCSSRSNAPAAASVPLPHFSLFVLIILPTFAATGQ